MTEGVPNTPENRKLDVVQRYAAIIEHIETNTSQLESASKQLSNASKSARVVIEENASPTVDYPKKAELETRFEELNEARKEREELEAELSHLGLGALVHRTERPPRTES